MTKFFNILLAAAALAATPASAAVTTGTYGVASGGADAWDVVQFTVTAPGSYSMFLESATDNYMQIHSVAFDYNSLATNRIDRNDDFDGLNAGFSGINLSTGIDYFARVAHFASGAQSYTLTINGPGTVNFGGTTGAVPEPASWAMLIAGFGLTGAAARRRRTTAAVA